MLDSNNPGNPGTGTQKVESSPITFTKERVNELMQKRVERSHQSFFNRYGVKDLNELDDLFGKAKSVDGLNQKITELTTGNTDLQNRYTELEGKYKDMVKKYAFTSRNIRPELYNDIETYFKGKNLEITEDTLNEELKTHLDWCNKAGAVVSLGNEGTGPTDQSTERERAGQLFGVNLD